MEKLTTIEKLELLQTIMNSLNEDFLNLGISVKDHNFQLSTMLFDKAEYFRIMSKNYNSFSSGNQVDVMKIQINAALKILKDNKNETNRR